MTKIYLAFISLLLLSSCLSNKNFQGKRRINRVIQRSNLNDHFVGFSLFDPESNKFLYQRNADKLFTPASNQKVLTLYAALELMGDSIPALKYVINDDSLFFKGTGNPYTLNPNFSEPDVAINFLCHHLDLNKKLFYVPQPVSLKHFGKGWMWDDYNYSFQTERSALPIYENKLLVSCDTILPRAFKMRIDSAKTGVNRLSRALQINDYNLSLPKPDSVRGLKSPFITSDSLTIRLLSDTLKVAIELIPYHGPMNTIKQNAFPLYQKMMLDSDNFLAEQILLMSTIGISDTMDSQKTIEFIMDSLFSSIKPYVVWADGSGLSRYNKISPNALVYVLNQLILKNSREFLFEIFPQGGISGTLRDWYKAPHPYVIAKTGTMTGVHCLSGYLVTASGRLLVFSLMNNNYKGSSYRIKKKMENILSYIRDKY